MKTPRAMGSCIAVCSAVLLASLASVTSSFAQAELKIVAPAAPGGGWDSAARALQQVLVATKMAKSVQVINIAGAGGTVGLASFARGAKGDPNQIMVNGITMLGAVLANKSPVSLHDVTPLVRLTGDPLVVVVPASSPIKSVADLAEAMRKDIGRVPIAGGSAGGADHVLGGLIAKAAAADASKLNYVAYSGGGEALAAMLGAKVAAGVSGYNEFEPMIRTGKLRALAIGSATRQPGVDVPTLKEQGLDVEFVNWRAVMGAPGITPEQKRELVELLGRVVKTKEWLELVKSRGWEDYFLSGPDFDRFLEAEETRMKDVLTSLAILR